SVLEDRSMPGAKWFPGARLNYAEHSFGTAEQADEVAVTAVSQTRADFTLTFAELRAEVARVRRSEEHTSELQSRFDLVYTRLHSSCAPSLFTLPLHDALPIPPCSRAGPCRVRNGAPAPD